MFYGGVASGVHARLTSSNNAGHENNKRTRANRGEKAGGPQNKLCTAHNRLIVQAAPKYHLNPFHHTSHSLCFLSFARKLYILYKVDVFVRGGIRDILRGTPWTIFFAMWQSLRLC